jgi:hypothetical protein
MMATNDTKKYKRKLVEIQKEEQAGVRLNKLTDLAKEVGASTTRMVRYTDEPLASNKITETEIVQNIEVALQTASMIDMCKLALIAAVAALLSALAAWVAVCK